MMFTGQVFIAYSHRNIRDRQFTRDLVDQLEDAGLKVWYDGKLRGGQTWRDVIENELSSSDAVIVVWSKAAAASSEVKDEITFASNIGVEKLIPLMLEDCHLPMELTSKQIVEVTHDQVPSDGSSAPKPMVPLAALLKALDVSPIPPFFAVSDGAGFHAHAAKLFGSAKRIVLIGMGLNLLHRDPLTESIFDRATAEDCKLEIYLANPESPQVQARLIEEEQGNTTPSVGREGLVKRIESLVGMWQDKGRSSNIEIYLLQHPPTYALIIIDDVYFIYPYGYKTLGNFSPVVGFQKAWNPGIVQFLEQQYDQIRTDAVKAETALALRRNDPINVSSLSGLAVFFVPPADSPLYMFGSKIIGYDVRNKTVLDSPWSGLVGNASEYGMHLTIADALFFLGNVDVEAIAAEIQFLAKEFRPFTMTNLRFQENMPAKGMLSIVGEDPSGVLEALHGEFLTRIYRRAVASQYSLAKVPVDRDKDIKRARFMINHYQAPYILNRYKPHFTLLGDVTSGTASTTKEKLNDLWQNLQCPSSIHVDRLALMRPVKGQKHWQIWCEVALG